MSWSVLLLGAYGLFGTRIAGRLARETGWRVLLAGRDLARAQRCRDECRRDPHCRAELVALAVDAHDTGFAALLQRERPDLVINCAGPFQGQGYAVAQECLQQGAHYIDLADGRDYVREFGPALDALAQAQGRLAVSGASSVPGLSAAVIDCYRGEFARLDRVDIGISPGNRTERGLATVAAILSYVGQPLPWREQGRTLLVHGWQRLQRQRYAAPAGVRWLAACDVPDLDLFPARYALAGLSFRAGLELRHLHFGLWLLSWLARAGLLRELPRRAALLKRMSEWFAGAGSDTGAMHVALQGHDARGNPQRIYWEIVASSGDGPQIPATAAVLLARKLAAGEIRHGGARACLDLFTLEEFLASLQGYAIAATTHTE